MQDSFEVRIIFTDNMSQFVEIVLQNCVESGFVALFS